MNKMASITILIVEDHPLYREGLLSMLQRDAPDICCLTAVNAAQATDLLSKHTEIGLVIADHVLPDGVDGASLLQQIHCRHPTVALALMSGANDSRLNQLARQKGFAGYFSKSLEPACWIKALGQILEGNTHFMDDASMTALLLTQRQIAVLQLAAMGMGNREIGEQLGLTERNVKYHLGEAFARLSTTSRTEAVARAAAMGLIALETHV